jgi:hypothetical protein
MVKSLPTLHDVAGMAGVNLPAYLGDIKPIAKPLPSAQGGIPTQSTEKSTPPSAPAK